MAPGVVGAEVPLEEAWRGVQRLARLVAGPIRECFEQATGTRTDDVPILLGVAEGSRPGRFGGMDGTILPLIAEALDTRLHPSSRLIPMGRVSGAIGVLEAAKLLNTQGYQHVIVAGADTLLVSETLSHLDQQGRLLTEDQSDGLIPGEGGAAVLLSSDRGGDGLKVSSLGLALETATVGSDQPLRGEGLAKAFRQALEGAGLAMARVDYRLSSMNGEQVLVQGT